MRQGTAVAIFAALVGAALLYAARSSRESIEVFRRGKREVVRFRRSPSPRPGLLSVAPAVSPSPAATSTAKGSPRPVPVTEGVPASDSPDSLCGFLGGVPRGSDLEYDRALGEYLVANGPRDESTELFLALESGDWDAVADLGRSARIPEAEEIAFLARTGLIDRMGAPGNGKNPAISLDPRDLDTIEEFRRRDPRNSFWPLVEAYLKQRENVPNDRATLIAEAASLPDYRNPVASFYGGVRRGALASGDDRAYLAFASLETRVPTLDGDFYRSLAKDVGRDPANDEMIGWVGKTMVGAQFFATEHPGPEAFMDAFSGGVITGAAERGKALGPEDRREIYERFARQFSLSEEEGLLESALRSGCAEEDLSERIESLRRRTAEGE